MKLLEMVLTEMRQDLKDLKYRVEALEYREREKLSPQNPSPSSTMTKSETTPPTTINNDTKVEPETSVSYTDPQEQLLNELKERMGLTPDKG